MKKSISVFLLSFLMVVGLMCSCSKPEMGKMIPKDAPMVVSINVDKAVSALDASSEDSENFNKEIEKLMKRAGAPDDTREALANILKNPEKMGMDLRYPIMFFGSMSLKNGMACVGALHSKSDFEEFLASLHSLEDQFSVVRDYKDGLKYAVMEHSFVVAFNDDNFAFYPAKYRDEPDELMAELSKIFTLKPEESLQNNQAFQKMYSKQGVAQLLVLGEGLSSAYGMAGIPSDELSKLMPAGFDMNGIAVISNLVIEKGYAEIEQQTVAMSDKAEKFIENLPVGEVDNDFGDYLDKKNIGYGVGNVDGSLILKLLLNNEVFKAQLGYDPQVKRAVEMVFNTIDGDIAFCFESAPTGRHQMPELSLFVKTKDAKWLKLVEENRVPGLQNKGENAYVFAPDSRRDVGTVVFGDEGGKAYLLMGNREREFKKVDDNVEETGKGKNFYARLNAQPFFAIPEIAKRMERETMGMGDNFTDLIDYFELICEDNTTTKFRVVMKDQDKTPVKACYDEFFSLYKRMMR